jgi:hypothetical protein
MSITDIKITDSYVVITYNNNEEEFIDKFDINAIKTIIN